MTGFFRGFVCAIIECLICENNIANTTLVEPFVYMICTIVYASN